MNNKKLNKGIVTGLTAVALFAPMALHNAQVKADTNNNGSSLRTAFTGHNVKAIQFSDDSGKVTTDGANSTNSLQDGNSYDLNHITSVDLNDAHDTQKSFDSSKFTDVGSLTKAVDDAQTSANQGTSNVYNTVTTSSNSNNSSNSNSGYTAPQTNNSSQAVKFPTAPTVNSEASGHKATKHTNKVSTKQLNKINADVKKNQKHLNNIKKELKEAKGKSHKAKLNKQLKQAKKSFAKSEVQLNHAKHAVK